MTELECRMYRKFVGMKSITFLRRIYNISIYLIIVLLNSSCEKNINLTLHDAPNTLVIDASIENGKPPVVVLSKSMDYFSKITPIELANSFVHNAEVYISTGNQTQKLKEYHVDSTGGFTISYYTVDSANPASAFIGIFNQTYNLKVISEGKEYSANTTIPLLYKRPDSLWWKPKPFETDTSKVVVMVRSSDPPGLGNYVRYYTKRNREPFFPGENSVFDDEFIDGTTYQIPVEPGKDRNRGRTNSDNNFRRGDTVTLKLSNIDRYTYRFWISMEFAYQSIGNPFASPNAVLGNISNGALGAFCGYASSTRTLIIPK